MLIDLEMAIAYWNLILKDRFKHLDLWCDHLRVSLLGHAKIYSYII